MQIQQFQKRFKKIPKVIELDHLTVTGDVYFGRNVTLRGTVIIVANEGQRIDIPDGCILENRLLSGNLTMTVRTHACMRVVARSRRDRTNGLFFFFFFFRICDWLSSITALTLFHYYPGCDIPQNQTALYIFLGRDSPYALHTHT